MTNVGDHYSIKEENSDKCADIDANGSVIYIVAQEGDDLDRVLLLRIKLDQIIGKDIAAYATIGLGSSSEGEGMVMAGDYSYFAWAVGDFPTLDNVIVTDDTWYWYIAGGSYWYGTVLPLTVDPQDDDIIVVADENDVLWESFFSSPITPFYQGTSFIQWQALNNALPIDPSVIRIWDLELDSISIGNTVFDGSPLVEYSPSRGAYFYDSTENLDLLTGRRITSMIVGSVS